MKVTIQLVVDKNGDLTDIRTDNRPEDVSKAVAALVSEINGSDLDATLVRVSAYFGVTA